MNLWHHFLHLQPLHAFAGFFAAALGAAFFVAFFIFITSFQDFIYVSERIAESGLDLKTDGTPLLRRKVTLQRFADALLRVADDLLPRSLVSAF